MHKVLTECTPKSSHSEVNFQKVSSLRQSPHMVKTQFKSNWTERKYISQQMWTRCVAFSCVRRMVDALENLWQDGCVLNPLRLCNTITEVVQEHYGVYVTYCSNASYQERKLRELTYVADFVCNLTQLK